MQFPTRRGIVQRGPLAKAWISSLGGSYRYDLPKAGETCIFSGTKAECIRFTIDAYHNAMGQNLLEPSVVEEAESNEESVQEAYNEGWRSGYVIKVPRRQQDTTYSIPEYVAYCEGHYDRNYGFHKYDGFYLAQVYETGEIKCLSYSEMKRYSPSEIFASGTYEECQIKLASHLKA